MAAPDDAPAALAAAQQSHRGEPLGPLLERRRLGAYRGYAERLAQIAALAEGGARLSTIGRSVRGEPLLALHLGAERPAARTTVLLSAVHPMEWIGVEVHLALLERLAHTDLGDRAVIAVPLVNPDGLLRVEADLREGRRRFVRHNARGVDLNRNFDARWDERGLVQRLLSFVFSSGPSAGSEPEVAALAHHLAPRRVDRALSLHSFGGAVLYPSAASLFPIWDAAEHRDWARRIALAAHGGQGRPYRALPRLSQ
jgi:predicted deacylase